MLSMVALVASLNTHPAFAADDGIYKTTGADGSTEFTDKPRSGTATSTSEYSTSSVGSQNVNDPYARSDEFSSDRLGGRDMSKIRVGAVEITSPLNNQTLAVSEDSILITIAMGPDNRLPEGYTAQIQMNDEVVANGSRKQTNIPVPDQGTHTLVARILNSNGKTIVISDPVKIHVN